MLYHQKIRMTVDQLIDLEIKTREMVSALENEIEDADRHSAPPGQLDGTEGRLSRQNSLMRHQMDKEAQRRRHLRLRLLHEAGQRMDSGQFGYCANCKREIEYERLDAQPETMICGPCASRSLL